MLEHLDKPESSSEQREELPRLELLKLAQSLEVPDADLMTRAELRAAIDKARRPEPAPRTQPVTWVSVARRLLASIVEQGLHLPDAAALIRGDTTLNAPPSAPPPVATVTLARIYAAQGHVRRAVATLDEVLATDPDHDIARDLREQLQARLSAERAAAQSAEAAKESTRPPEGSTAPPPPLAETGAPVAQADPDADAALQAPLEQEARSAAPQAEGPPSAQAEAPPSAPAEAPPSAPTSRDLARPAPARPPPPRRPELLLIETGAAHTYVYWELAWPRSAAGEPQWISLVAHTPGAAGSEREERVFPVQHDTGVLKLEGLPSNAVLRAKLSSRLEPNTPPLAVAGCVRASSKATAPASSIEPNWQEVVFEPRFSPHSRLDPAALAGRARAHLPAASPAYW